MNSENKRSVLLVHLDTVEERVKSGDITLNEIIFIFGLDGHSILILFLVMPFLQPIPLLGLSTPFGLFIAFVAIFAFLNKPPRIPEKWGNKKISAHIVSKIAEGAEKIIKKMQFLFKPRMSYFFGHPFSIINVTVIVINAALLALPLPIPFSNIFPAWAIFLQAFAKLEEDGFLVMLSYIQTLICFGYFFILAKGALASFYFLNTNY